MNGKIWTEEEFLNEIHKSGEEILITKDRLKEILQENLKLSRLNDSQSDTIKSLQQMITSKNERIQQLNDQISCGILFDRLV